MAAERTQNGNNGVVLNVNDGDNYYSPPSPADHNSASIIFSVPFMQKLIAEMVGTFLLVFAGCAALLVHISKDGVVSFVGIGFGFGLTLMALIYCLGHISGAHFNPAVTLAFASCNRFPLKHVVPYVLAQMTGGTLSSGVLRLIFHQDGDHFAGTLPTGSSMQSFVIEFITTFSVMFVLSGVATDNRAVGEMAGLAVGATVLVNVVFSGPITGASMNPARSLGPAIVWNDYSVVWIYIVAPILGAIFGAWVYNMVRYTDKPMRELVKSASFVKSRAVSHR